jgi:glycerol-3-phosphate acyltransferase PlsY
MAGAASPLEIAWTIAAVCGFLFSLWLAFEGGKDFVAVREAIADVPPRARRWGPRWWIGLSALVANSALCYPWLVFGGIGVIAMQFPPPPPTAQQQVSSQWVGWLFLSAEVVLAAVQIWHRFVRSRVEQADRRRP